MTVYNLEERTLQFALSVRSFTRKLPKTLENTEDIKQLIRASGSVGANYIEANESLGDKDKIMRMKISRKEAKEARYFARLIYTGGNPELETEKLKIIQEATELMNILGAIIIKISS